MKALRSAFLVLSALPWTACNCSEGPLTKMPPPMEKTHLDAGFVFPDAAVLDSGVVLVPDAGPEARVLAFEGTPPVVVYLGNTKDLTFKLTTASGAAVPNATVGFEFAGGGGRLSGSDATTNDQGEAMIRFIAGTTPAQGTLVATADLAPTIALTIIVKEDPNTRLIVDVASSARVPVGAADAQIFLGARNMLPTCAALLGGAQPPSPTLTAMFPMVPGSSAFPMQHSGLYVTALANGRGPSGGLVARGCTEGVRLAGGVDTHVLVTLDQLPPNLDGNYDALLALDIGDTIPPPVGPVIVLITDLLSDPAGWISYQLLAVADDNFGTGFVEWNPSGMVQVRASFHDVENNQSSFPVWLAARNAFDGFLTQQFGQPYTDLKTIGGDIAHLIRNFEVGAGYTVTSTGTMGRVKVNEAWQAMVFQWRYGCPAGDLGCARHAIDLSGPNGNLVPETATYGASVLYTPTMTPPPGELERYTLNLDAHRIDIRYGAIILLILDQLVFPNLPPPLNGNSLTDVINHLVDCPNLANSLSMSTGIPAPFFQGICMSAVSAAAMYIENQILMLDSMNNPGLIAGGGPSGGGQIVLVDRDLDLSPEIVEAVNTPLSWSTGQMINTPITGSGRRRATHCHTDTDCMAPTLCTPIPSYLKVRALENDCRARVGMSLGAVTCGQNSDCASDLCFDAGMGRHLCFTACTGSGAGSCSMGNCMPNVASLNLDGVLMGLGNALESACVP